jgi:5-methylcytosine-specific restriction endonuclease McrA
MQLYSTSDELLYNLEAITSSEARRKWRQSIKEEWDYQCAYCGSEENLTLDHITPRSKGGSDRVTNVLCACKECNNSKGHQMWSDWFLTQDFFSTEKLSKIIEWQKQIRDKEVYYYRPRRNNLT